jgi:hypothetical protein
VHTRGAHKATPLYTNLFLFCCFQAKPIDETKSQSKIVDWIIIIVIGTPPPAALHRSVIPLKYLFIPTHTTPHPFIAGGLLAFFVLWPLLICYFFIVVGWLVMWPFMKFVPACGNHHWAAPAYRVLSVAALSPMQLIKMLWARHKDADGDGIPDKDQQMPKVDDKKKPTDAPGPVIADKV